MHNRRKFLLTLVAGVVALGVVGTVALADELFGVITKVDVDAKKITVQPKEGKEVDVTITDKTELVTKKGSNPVDLEKLNKQVTKAQEKGRKGITAKIEVEKGVASKIAPVFAKKKGLTGTIRPDRIRHNAGGSRRRWRRGPPDAFFFNGFTGG